MHDEGASYYLHMASKADFRVRIVFPLATCLALLTGGCASSTPAVDGDVPSPPASSSVQDASNPSAESESEKSTAGQLLGQESDPETDARAMLVSVIEALKQQSDIEAVASVRWDAEGASISAVPLTIDGRFVEEVPFYYDGAQFEGDFETLSARKGTETTTAGVHTAAEIEELLPKIDAIQEAAAPAFQSANAVKTEGATLDGSVLELRGYLRYAEKVEDGKCYFRSVVQQYLTDTDRLAYEDMDGLEGSLTGYPTTSDALIVEGSTCSWK